MTASFTSAQAPHHRHSDHRLSSRLFRLWHIADDPYNRLSSPSDAGGRPVNVPARSKAFTDKAAAHAELLREVLGPATVIVRPWSERPLTAKEVQTLDLDEPNATVFVSRRTALPAAVCNGSSRRLPKT